MNKLQKNMIKRFSSFATYEMIEDLLMIYYPFEDNSRLELFKVFKESNSENQRIVFFMPKAPMGKFIDTRDVDYYFNQGRKKFKQMTNLINFI